MIKFGVQCTGYNASYDAEMLPQAQLTLTGANEKGQQFNNKGETGVSNISVTLTLHGDKRKQVGLGDTLMLSMDSAGNVTLVDDAVAEGPVAGMPRKLP